MYKLVLGISNQTGQVCVRRNGSVDWSDTAIAVGQSTILDLVCQAGGSFGVFADDASVFSRSAAGTMTGWDPFRKSYKDEPNWVGAGVPGGNWDAWRAAMAAQFPTAIDKTSWDSYLASGGTFSPPIRDILIGAILLRFRSSASISISAVTILTDGPHSTATLATSESGVSLSAGSRVS